MRRRDLLLGLAGAVAAPRAACAQVPGRTYRIAMLSPFPRTSPNRAAFFETLGRLGFAAGKNLEIDDRGDGLRPGQFPAQAALLVKAKPDMILCVGPDAIRAAQKATTAIPLLGYTDDMLGEGLVASLAHPGGNTTGVSFFSPELDAKRLEILVGMLGAHRRIDALAGTDTAIPRNLQGLQDAARTLGVELVVRTVHTEGEIAPAIEAAKAAGAAGLNVLGSAILARSRRVIIERTAALRLPAIYQWPEMAREGGLIAYGPSLARINGEQLPRLARKLLRGVKPADIPVEQPDKFELVVNLKTAKALGLSVPQALLAQADDIIQ